ncbi:MAG TPA: nicotinate phosphoribosyltransferase [Steroidobacteraceae bacterium]|nr:nicotinate phosphoribosyltransferase [Steroidobacteraceae bacterium]
MKSPAFDALLTDFYELAMAQAYFQSGMNETAVFELFVRRLPQTRQFLVAAGLEQVVDYLEQLRFEDDDLAYLSSLNRFSAPFLDHLGTVRFTGAVHAMPEGTPFFADEPVLRVTAPLLEAQLLESRLLNIVHFQTTIASKAARCVIAARGRQLIDFGMRRAHEASAGLFAARASYLAGFDATATVAAGQRFGIPLSGTMAHSFIEAHESEPAAFRDFIRSRGEPTTLLIDTYDTDRAVQRVISLLGELEARAVTAGGIRAVRIDSGDLGAQARRARAAFDAHGYRDIQIVLSGGLDEHQIEELLTGGVPADAFGVGTALDVSSDAPALDMAYKLEEYAGRPRRKSSPGKATWPGAKQVYRERRGTGRYLSDRIVRLGESAAGQPLLQEVMRNGRRSAPLPALGRIRDYCHAELEALPPALRELGQGPERYPVSISEALRALAESLDSAQARES